MRTLEQIEQEIAETKAALNDVHGTETEVYARIVGYYRAVKHWNKGKRDEFDQRKLFSLEETKDFDSTIANIKNNVEKKAEVKTVEVIADSNSVTYELYTRQTCPNCPPVKDFLSNL
jgi:ribonucleoside-triphosphate reductase